MGALASSDEEGVRSTADSAAKAHWLQENIPPPHLSWRGTLAAACRCMAYSAFRSRSVICVNVLQPVCFDYYKV